MKSYQDLLQEYKSYLDLNDLDGKPAELYDPANYLMSLGGKRIRPLLALLGHQLVGNDIKKALPLAHAIELFHNFTLMHDDIMDNALVRRGQPTVHVKWNSNIGILSGDLMLVKAYQYLNALDTDHITKAKILETI